ncbi:Chloroperoxidase [Armillaria luteobubalina]|uniref:Chloroperoxidase n=1 Tax=Armillaria luteobubalina TaxID=153913 RepID=A0AA39U0S0_9AGAR|nr:Chloroperoxidase [Armillaria luteobubalina]
MRLSFAFVAVLVSRAHASFDWNLHEWKAPGPSDLRGPCPGLNTLANHGFLPRDDKNITINMVLKAGKEGFNVDPDVLILAAKVGLLTTNALDSFTLDDIKLHGTIEHDASLSRSDYNLGDNASTISTRPPQAKSRKNASLMIPSPTPVSSRLNTDKEFFVRTRESALYLSVMGDPAMGSVAPKKFVDIFFREERMPIEEGWTRPTTATTI